MIDGGLRPLFRKYLPEFHWQSVETGGTGAGIPDSNYCTRNGSGQGCEGWVEYKMTRGWTVPLRPEQVGWIARRVRAGGRVWIAVRQMDLRERDALWLVPGALAAVAKAGGLRAAEASNGSALPYWGGGPAAWGWRAIAAALVA